MIYPPVVGGGILDSAGGSGIPSIVPFHTSSGTGDEKLKLTEAALTVDAAGEEVAGGGTPLAAFDAASSCLLFSWNLAARSLSRWIFLADFFLCFFSFDDGFRCRGFDFEWISLGFPRKTEKFMKALPFTESINRRDFLLDFQHFTNSLKVERRKTSSVKFVFVLCIV